MLRGRKPHIHPHTHARARTHTHTHTHVQTQNYEKPKTLYTTDLSRASDAKNDPGGTGDIKPWSTDRVSLKLIQFYPITLRELKWMRSKLGRAREACPATFEVTAVHQYHPSAHTQMLSAPSNSKPESAFLALSPVGMEGKLSSQADPNPSIPHIQPLESHPHFLCVGFPNSV